jgi:hypothetical protein
VLAAAVYAVVAGYRSYTAIAECVADLPVDTATLIGIDAETIFGGDDSPAVAVARPGATAEAIAALEAKLGLKLPADLAASLAIHDGGGAFERRPRRGSAGPPPGATPGRPPGW